MRIVIVGAGIGGLTAALALQRHGFSVEVIEQVAELGEVGAGLQLSPNGTRVLEALGLGPALEAVGAEPRGKRIRLWNTGQTWKLFDLGEVCRERYGHPYINVHRADLHTTLANAVRAVSERSIRTGVAVDGIEMVGDEVVLRSGGQEVARADVVIGADGIHSRVRRILFGDSNPRFTGIIAWRGVVDATRLPPHLRDGLGYNWVGPGSHVIHYPVRRGELINLVFSTEEQGWAVESWNEVGSKEKLAEAFQGWHEDVHTLIGALERPPGRWAMMLRDPMTCWTQRRVALLGDACHPTLPTLAQGAVMAMEDGWVLARCMAAQPDDPVSALRRYEGARMERANRMVRVASDTVKRFHNPALADAQGAARYVDEQWSREKVEERYDWLFSYDALGTAI